MPNLENLKPAVERKSGQNLVSFNKQELRSRLGYDIDSMQTNGFDPSVVEEHQAFNDELEVMLEHPDVSEYLSSLTTKNIYIASGVRVLTLDSIKEEIQRLKPSAILFHYGYLPIASSIGGNIVCLHLPTNQVVWADHTIFSGDLLSFKNPLTMKWESIPNTAENIPRALTNLAKGLENFLSDLLDEKLEKQLDELD